jgi:glycosyltransferase involved in cell wall biosynthesis
MNSDEPLVTVLMSVYNAEDTLERAVRSILAQTYIHFELLIVDDGSTDGCSQILMNLHAEDCRIVIIRQDNTGLTRALNNGAKVATGELIARLDADDYAEPDRLKKQVQAFVERPDLVLLGSKSIDRLEDGSRYEWPYYNDQDIQMRVYLCAPFAHSTAMFKTSIFQELGGYDESFKTAQDTELWMRLARRGSISMLDEALVVREVHAAAISSRRKYRQFYDALRARLMHYTGSPVYAAYFSTRALMIALLPPKVIMAMKGKG